MRFCGEPRAKGQLQDMFRRIGKASALSAIVACGAISAPAYGAGLYVPPAPVYGPAPVIQKDLFAGWWVGGTLGGASLKTHFSGAVHDITGSGLMGGVTGGYNWQTGPIVIGLEGDVLTGDTSGQGHGAKASLGTQGDVRLRVGVTVVPQMLVFATLGGALADANYKVIGAGSVNDPLFGWTVGGGAEVKLGENWSARFDYQHTNFESDTVSYTGGKDKFNSSTNTYRGSLIYHF